VQQKEPFNDTGSPEICDVPMSGRLLGLDPGTRHIGLAVSDESQLITTPVPPIQRKSWKNLLAAVGAVIAEYDAVALVVGLPLNTDGSESPMSKEAREMARKFGLSLEIPVCLQDERVTSYEARGRLWSNGVSPEKTKKFVDSEAASIILADFLDRVHSARS
jgi:putative Holliday junction resolvase